MLNRLGTEAIITNDPIQIYKAEKLILPGVGNFDHGMNNLNSSGLVNVLNECVLEKQIPILGICLGGQLMTKSSEEGILSGLGWLDATVKKFDKKKLPPTCKIPHMGWNSIKLLKDSSLFMNINENPRYYFVHSFHFDSLDTEIGLSETYYGYNFLSSLEKNNIFAVQFHPEKSHKYGLKLMQNFINL
jgi:glutamine amidotransferase